MADERACFQDDDLIIGRKRIMALLGLADWHAIVLRIEREGLPVVKIGGRIEMSKEAYRTWRASRMPGHGIIKKDGTGNNDDDKEE